MNLPPLDEMMRQAQAFTQQLAKIKEDLAKQSVSATAGGGMVTVRADGCGQVLAIEIEPEVCAPEEKEMLQDLVVAAVNLALKKSKELAAEAQRSLTGGMPIPGLDQLFS